MSKAMFKPDAVLDGQEFSAMTRFLEAMHDRKEVGVDDDMLDSAKDAKAALEANAPIGEDDLKNLVELAKKYKDAVEKDQLEQFPNVKDMELKRLVQKLEGMLAQQETKLDGKKVHPAAMPPGAEPEKPPKTEPAQRVEIVATPETKKADDEKMKAAKAKLPNEFAEDVALMNKKK